MTAWLASALTLSILLIGVFGKGDSLSAQEQKSPVKPIPTVKPHDPFPGKECSDCHRRVESSKVNCLLAKEDLCEFCHKVDGWKAVDFDHNTTKFALDGRHKSVECKGCHKPLAEGSAEYEFAGVKTACEDCHQDIHRGQFAMIAESGSAKITQCNRCHTPNSWNAEKFDHNRDSAFKLDGAHVKLACQECHKTSIKDNTAFTIYKPLDATCSSCHGVKNLQNTGSGS